MHAYTARDRALELALLSVHVVSIDGTTSTTRTDYTPSIDEDGYIRMVEGAPAPIHIELALTLNGRKHLVHLVRDEHREVHLDGWQGSGVAGVWLSALDLFGLRFTFSKVQHAVTELGGWLQGEGKTSEVATFIDVITLALEAMGRGAADDFEAKYNPYPAFTIALAA